MTNSFRVTTLAIFAASAISANALTFSFQTEGSTAAAHGADYTEIANVVTLSETDPVYRAENSTGLTVDSVHYTLSETTPGANPISVITGGGGTVAGKYNGLDYTLSFLINGGALVSDSSLSRSFAANILTFSITSADASINGLTGSGKVGGTLVGDSSLYAGLSKSSFDLQAVPEPASMAVFAIGAVGFLARRRRS